MLLQRYHLVQPSGFSIPAEAAQIHGISTERASLEGLPLPDVLQQLSCDVAMHSPSMLVAHNLDFDLPIMLAEFCRTGMKEPISPLSSFCTMTSTTELCKLPPLRNGKHKWPRLNELHRHIFSCDLQDAHDAAADVLNCAKCFFELQRMGLAPSGMVLSQPITPATFELREQPIAAPPPVTLGSPAAVKSSFWRRLLGLR